jgi:hypothetical protein
MTIQNKNLIMKYMGILSRASVATEDKVKGFKDDKGLEFGILIFERKK